MNAFIALLAADTKSQSSIFSILILVLPLGAIFYLMVIPQRKQKAKHAAFVSSIGVGSEVVTAGGMYGKVTFIEDGVAHLEVDTDVVVRVSLSSLSRSAVDEPSSTASSDSDSSDEKTAGDASD